MASSNSNQQSPVPANSANQNPAFNPGQQQQLKSTIDKTNWQDAVNSQYNPVPIPYHVHSDLDSPRIDYSDLTGKIITFSHVLFGTNGATAANYSVIFIVPINSMFYSFSEVHTTAGSDAGAVTLNIEKLTGTTAPGAGTNLLSTTINLKGTANTVQNGALLAKKTTLQLSKNDRLSLVLTGTPTALANVLVTGQIIY